MVLGVKPGPQDIRRILEVVGHHVGIAHRGLDVLVAGERLHGAAVQVRAPSVTFDARAK